MLSKIRTDVILVWLSISIGIVINTKLFLYFITEETGEEYFLKSNRIIQLILCKKAGFIWHESTQSVDFVIIRSHNRGVQSGIPLI